MKVIIEVEIEDKALEDDCPGDAKILSVKAADGKEVPTSDSDMDCEVWTVFEWPGHEIKLIHSVVL
jgi:hypothetical protein